MEQTRTRVLVGAATAGLIAIDGLYLAIIHFQREGEPGPADVLTVPFVAGYIAVMAVLLGASLVSPAAAKPVLRSAASSGLVVLGVLAAFSIGLLILVVAGLAIAATVAALRTSSKPLILITSGVASLVAVVVLLGGFQVVSQYLVCPATASMGGTTAGFFGHVSYECNNGQLTTH